MHSTGNQERTNQNVLQFQNTKNYYSQEIKAHKYMRVFVFFLHNIQNPFI